MNPFAQVALFGWLVVGPALVALLRGRRGVLASLMLGFLFLPMARIEFSGLPDYTKFVAVSVATLLGVILTDASRVLRPRVRPIDAPMILWCLVPMASSITNGLGVYDGMSASLDQTILWGIPWMLGRIYFADSPGMRDLAIGLVLGTLIYLPFVVWELRMSPNLHHTVYGFHQHQFIQTRRFGGWRPMVFMQHGLALSLFMAAGAIVATWLWITAGVRTIVGIPIVLIAGALVTVTVLCKSTGSIALLALVLGTFIVARALRLRLLLVALLLAAPTYMALRSTRIWDGQELVRAASVVSVDRAESLKTRLDAENLLTQRALDMPVFGWGGWGDWRVTNDRGSDMAITDGLWVIALGQTGLVGLGSLTASLALPVFLLLRRVPRANLFRAVCAPSLSLAGVLIAFQLDTLLNAMLNPLFTLAAGAIAGLVTRSRVPARQPARHAPAVPPLAAQNAAPDAPAMPQPPSPARPSTGGLAID